MYTLTVAQMVGWVLVLFGGGVVAGIAAKYSGMGSAVGTVGVFIALFGFGLLIGTVAR